MAIELSGEMSRTTHAAREPVDACRYFAGLLVGALSGESKAALLAPRFHPTRGAWGDGELIPEIDRVASLLVTLVEDHEPAMLGVPDLGRRAVDVGLYWLHLPIVDVSVPSPAFEADWPIHARDLVARLERGESLVLHCKGGLGRTGLVAARLLIELGHEAADAIARVRAVRPGAIETSTQESNVLRYDSVVR